jgi:YVTN family beta-propeller protein
MSFKWSSILIVPALLALACGGGRPPDATPTPTPSPAVTRPSPTREPTPTAPAGPRVIDTIRVGPGLTFGIRDLAINTSTNRIYVVAGEQMAVIDGDTNQVIDVVALEGIAKSIAVNSETNRIHLSAESGQLWVIDGETNEIVATIPGVFGAYPGVSGRLAVNPATNRIYVADIAGQRLVVIDGDSNTEVGSVAVDVVGEPAVNTATNRIYVVGSDSGKVTVIDGETDQLEAVIEIGPRLSGITVNPKTNRIYVSQHGDEAADAGRLIAVDGESHEILSTVAAGQDRIGLPTVNPTTNRIYVSSSGSGSGGAWRVALSVVDLKQPGTRLSGLGSVAINPTTNRIYSLVAFDNSVAVLDGASDSILTNIKLGLGLSSIAINPETNNLYVGTRGDQGGVQSHSVMVVDLASRTIIRSIPVMASIPEEYTEVYGDPYPIFASPVNGLTVDASENRVYVSTGRVLLNPQELWFGTAGLLVFDGTENTTIASLDRNEELVAAAINTETNRMYVSSLLFGGPLAEFPEPPPGVLVTGPGEATGLLLVIDTNDYSAVETIPFDSQPVTASPKGGIAALGAIAVNPKTNLIYVANPQGSVSVIDGTTNSVSNTLDIVACSLAVNPDTNGIFVGICDSDFGADPDRVTIIDGATDAVLASITVGNHPSAIAVNVNTNRVYVANRGSDTVSVIDGHTNRVIATLDVGVQPVDIAVDPTTNRIYVANSKSDTITVIEDAGGQPQ